MGESAAGQVRGYTDEGAILSGNAAYLPIGRPKGELDERTRQLVGTMDGSSPVEREAARMLLEGAWRAPVACFAVYEFHGDNPKQYSPLSDAAPIVRQISDLGLHRAVGAGARTLYEMAVPPELAKGLSTGALRSMRSSGGGIYSAVARKGIIEGHATFKPVSIAGIGVGASPAGWAVMGALVATSVLEAKQRAEDRRMLGEIKSMLDRQEHESIRKELAELRASADAIQSTAALLLDRPLAIGPTLGVDSAVHSVRSAFHSADLRLDEWLSRMPAAGKSITYTGLQERWPGLLEGFHVSEDFRTKVQMAAAAADLYRRALLLQAEYQAQQNPEFAYEYLRQNLTEQHTRIDEFETRLANLLNQLSAVKVRMSPGLKTSSEANDRLRVRDELAQLAAHSAATLPASRSPLLPRSTVSVALVSGPEGTALLEPPAGAIDGEEYGW